VHSRFERPGASPITSRVDLVHGSSVRAYSTHRANLVRVNSRAVFMRTTQEEGGGVRSGGNRYHNQRHREASGEPLLGPSQRFDVDGA